MSRTVEDKSMLHDAGSTENSRLLELPDEQLLKEDAIARLLTTSLSKLRRLRAIGQGPPSVKISEKASGTALAICVAGQSAYQACGAGKAQSESRAARTASGRTSRV